MGGARNKSSNKCKQSKAQKILKSNVIKVNKSISSKLNPLNGFNDA